MRNKYSWRLTTLRSSLWEFGTTAESEVYSARFECGELEDDCGVRWSVHVSLHGTDSSWLVEVATFGQSCWELSPGNVAAVHVPKVDDVVEL